MDLRVSVGGEANTGKVRPIDRRIMKIRESVFIWIIIKCPVNIKNKNGIRLG